MNKTYKVIYNRTRCMYQVVSELAKGHTKSETPEMLKSLFSKHSGLTRGIVMAVLSMSLAMPVGMAVQAEGAGGNPSGNTPSTSDTATSDTTDTTTTAADTNLSNLTDTGKGVITTEATTVVNTAIDSKVGSLDANGNYIQKDASVSSNLSTLDTQVKSNADKIGTLDANGNYIQKDASVSSNLSTLDTQVKTNADAISKETTDREAVDTTLTNKIGTLDANGNYIQKGASISSNLSTLDTQVNTNATNISTNTADINSLKSLSNISSDAETVIKMQAKQAVKVAATGNATVSTSGSENDDSALTYTINVSNNGTIDSGDTNLVSGGTMYTELRPASTGTYYYISNTNTTAANLIALDTNLKNVIDAIGLDADDTTTSYTSKLNKYFKVNPEVTTSTDGKTKTYAPDAAANGTNSVAIGPSAQAGEKTTDATTSTTTVTGGTSSTAIGDSAVANGDKSVALGYNSQVLNASGATTAVSGSTAIGNGAKVEGGSDSTALGTGATVDTASNAMALGTSAIINKTATSGVAIGNGAVTGSSDTTKTVDNVTYNVKAAGGEDSVAIGTSASSAGNTSIALGKGASIENDTDGSYQAVVKSDDIAIGTGAKTSASDSSTAIGKSATVSQSTDAMAIGSSATVGASSNNAMALGKGAAVSSGAADSIAMGTRAKTVSADTIAIGQDTIATGANSVVIGKGATTTVEGGNAIGSSSTASGSSTAIGQSATANNYNAVAIGNKATANADKSISLGYNAGVGTSEGKGETQNAGSLIAIGTSSGNNVSGMQNVAIGEEAGSNVKSNYNIAIGTQAGYGINYASDDKSQNGYNVSIGYQANYQENSANIMYSTALGNEANASNHAVAIGDKAKASGTYSLALGDTAQASDTESIALGHNTNAADGNIAIGNGSLAPAVSSLGTVQDGYVYKSTTTTDSSGTPTTTLTELKSAFTYKPLASDSHYISVGNGTLTRRISNVADGVFDSDAATVGQLNSLNELLQATDTKVGLTKDYFEQKFTNLNTTIDSSKTHYFSISESSDNLSGNKDNTGATSNKADAMAIGPNANATNVKSLAVGNNVYATGLRSIAIGTAPNPTTDSAGTTTTHNTSAEGENSIALGTSTTAQADNSVAIGTRAQTYTTDTTGNTGVSSVAIGNLATTAGNQSVAVGYNATVKYNYGTAIGAEALASGVDAVAIGKGSKAYSTDSMAIGQDNSVTGNNVYGLGSSNSFSGEWGAITQSGVSGYKNTVTSVSDQDTTNALTGIYMTGNSNTFNQNVKYNVMQDITLQGNSNTIDGGAGGTSSHQNTLSQIAIVGFGNTVQGKSSDDGKTNNIKDVTILGYNNKVDANTDTTVDFSNTQILGNNVTAALGNSVYLGNNAAYVQPTSPAQDAIDTAKTDADTAAEASDEYKAATTDEDKATIKAEYEAKYLYKLRVQAMEAKGSTAGMNSYSTDETYGNGTSYTYAGSNPTGVVTVGTAGSERRIQNVAAGLVSASSTDAVNGSQLYALTRQLRFGGDNSSFGTTTADDKNVVARGSNETISITGGSDAVTSSTADGTTTYTVDAAKLTGNNIAVVADKDANALHVQLASNLKDLNTAQLGSGSGESYKETIKLDGTGTNGGQMTLAGADGTVKTTLDTTGLTIANGPKFTSSGIDAASQQINHVTAGTADTDAANVGQVKTAAAEATTEVKAGTNASLGTVETSAADKHKIYTVNVDNLAVKANGTGTTVALANGINFKNGTNTTATVGTDGTVTINASHNKLSTVSAATGDNDNVTLTLTDADGNTVTSTGLKNTYTTVTKDGTSHTVTFARNDGTTETLSLDDLDGASKGELATAAAKATSEVTNGTNVTSVTKTTGNNNQNIYTVNVDDLAVKTTSGEKKSVHLADGLVFADGTNTTATVGDNGTIKYNVSDAAIRKQAVQAVNVNSGSNVTVTPETNTDGTLKTFTINATHNALKSATLTKGANDVSTLTITGNDGDTASVDIKNTYLTVSKDSTAKTVTFTSNDGTTPATTLSLSDFGAASTTDMTAAVAKATTEVRAGANASLGTVETDTTDQHKIYTVNVDNLGVSQNGTKAGSGVSLKNGLNFIDGTNTTASVAENGTVSYSVSNDAIKDQAKDAVVVAAGDNVSIDAPTDANNVKTYTVKVNDLKLQANGEDKGTRKLAEGINFANGKNITAAVENGKVVYSLNDALTDLTSVTAKDTAGNQTMVSGNGVTITPAAAGAQPISLTTNGLSMGNQQITNVASGGDTDTNAANISDVKRLVQASASGTTETGFNVKGDDAAAKKVKLGKQLNVVGGTTDSTKLSDNNIGVVTTADGDGNATLTVKLNKAIALDSVTAGNSTLDTNGLTIKDGAATKVEITSGNVTMGGNVIHNVGAGTETTDAVNKGQLDALQIQVNGGWNLSGNNAEGTSVTAQIGAGKTVTYDNGNYTKAVVTKDDTTGNATVKVDVTTGTLTAGEDGKITSTDGLVTTGAVAAAVNNVSWKIQDGNKPQNVQQVKAGDTVSFKAGDNLSLDQNGTEFTYKLNKTLMGMTSVTAVDDKQNTAVLNGEGLKVSDKDGNSLTQHATEIRLHDATKSATDTTTDVVLNKQGLQNGGHTITGVANGTVDAGSQDAINGSQLYELQQKVTNGWKITGNDTTKASNIGNDKTVSFVDGDNSYIKATVDTTNTGATVSYTAQMASLTKNADGKATLTGTTDGLVTGTNLTSVLNSLSWTAQSSKTGTGQNNGSTTAQSITAGTNVGFIAGDNMILTQDGTNFTYALNSNLTGMNTIAFTGLGNGASNLTIGLQNGGGANPDKGYYITGLSNTKWDQSNYEGSRAATEAQLREAIDKVSAATGTGGFGLTADEGANNGGEKKVSQTLGRTIAIQGDGTYDAEGKVVKPGNISTVAYTDNAGPTGAIKVKLNKDINLSETGSLTIGSSKVSSGSIVLDNTSDAAKKIALNSTAGTAAIGGVTVNGAEKTVNGLSNTTWNGTAVSGRAATENQLVDAINEVKTQAANSELHIKKGVYAIGKDSQGQDITDTKGKNSVSIDVVNAQGTVDGQVVINDVAKASELGTVGELADNLKNPAGGSTTVVQAVNKVNQKVDDSLKQVNGDISNAVTEAKKHTEVQSVDSDNNVTIDGTTTNTDGGTVYKLGLNKVHLNLGNVHVYGNEGRITANTVEAETVKIDDQTRLDKTGLTTGNTTVANNRIVVGGDNGIKIEANGGQQTISGLTNTDWTGTAVHGRAATEDQLAKAISSATTTAAQNEQHIKAGTYDIQTTIDDKGNKQNSVTMKIVDGTGKDKGTVTINDVAKASDVGDTDKLAADIKNQNGSQPQTTSVVEAVNNLNEKVNNRVGDNKYSAITSKDPVQDGDSSTTAIGKLNNRMKDIYDKATQHASVSVDENLTRDDTKQNASGGTDYKIGLNKENIDLGHVTIKGNAGSISAKSMTADSFTAGDTVVNNEGVKVGDKSALTGDSLKVGDKTYVDNNGLNANGNAIHNVGEGKEDTDAVNVKQVNDLAARQGEAITENATHIGELGRAVNKLGNRLNRVGAGAAALAALHPGTYDPNDKWDFSAGIGHYHDANAVAIGAYYHPNDTTILSIGGSMGGGENMVNAGITWKMGRSGREQAVQPVVVRKVEAAPVVQQAAPVRPAPVVTPAPVTTPAPVKSVASVTPVHALPAVTTPMTQTTTGDTATLAQILARQTAILEKLAQNQSQAAPSATVAHGDDIFPDVPDNHWAYAYVAKLEKAGALKGFKRPAVLKSPMMTRDDFASVLYTAMANGATTNPSLNGDDSLNRLAQEFKAELKNVKV